MAKTTKKKTGKKKPQKNFVYPNDEVRLKGIAFYFITGSVKAAAAKIGYTPKTIYEWIKRHPEIVKQAKAIANEHLDQKCAELIHYSYQGIVEKINTPAKRKKESLEALNRICGTMLDKLMEIRGLKKSTMKVEGDENKPLRIIWEDKNANSG